MHIYMLGPQSLHDYLIATVNAHYWLTYKTKMLVLFLIFYFLFYQAPKGCEFFLSSKY